MLTESDTLEYYIQQNKALIRENQLLKNQISKIEHNVSFFKTSTTEFLQSDEKGKNRRFKLFKHFIENINANPKNIYDESLKEFFQYIVQHLQLEQLQMKLRKINGSGA